MQEKIKKIYMKWNFIIPNTAFIFLNYTLRHKRIPNIVHPKRYSEKIQKIMINDKMLQLTDYVDKYKVRNFISETIGEKYLINLLGVYDSADEIEFDTLPNEFILKTNHGSGYFIICNDKNNFDSDTAVIQLRQWMNENYYYKCREKQYKNIKRKIICEELIGNINDFLDIRVFCFNGKPEFFQIDKGFAYGQTRRDHYDLNWNRIELKMKYDNMDTPVERPNNLDEIIRLSEILCSNFDFVRVDFYLSDTKIYFSELTFTPTGGRAIITPDKYDFILGSKLSEN